MNNIATFGYLNSEIKPNLRTIAITLYLSTRSVTVLNEMERFQLNHDSDKMMLKCNLKLSQNQLHTFEEDQQKKQQMSVRFHEKAVHRKNPYKE